MQEPIAYIPEDTPPSPRVLVIPKKKRSVRGKHEKVVVCSTYSLRSRIVSQKLTEKTEKEPLFAKELTRSSLGPGVVRRNPLLLTWFLIACWEKKEKLALALVRALLF